MATQIGTLTGEEVLAQATAAGAFYAILTADQQSKYDTLGPLGGDRAVREVRRTWASRLGRIALKALRTNHAIVGNVRVGDV